MLLFIIFILDYIFLNFVCISILVSLTKANKIKNTILGGKDVDLSSFGIK